jgi:hypothetical protein
LQQQSLVMHHAVAPAVWLTPACAFLAVGRSGQLRGGAQGWKGQV